MHPLTTSDDVDYRAERADAANDAAQARNDAHRKSTKRAAVLYTESGRYCPYCRWEMDDAGECDPSCDGVPA